MGGLVWSKVVVERCSRPKPPHVEGPPAQHVAAVAQQRDRDGLLEPHITIKGTLHWLSPCSDKYPPPAPGRVISGVTSNTNSSLTSKYSEHLKAFLSQQTSFSTSSLCWRVPATGVRQRKPKPRSRHTVLLPRRLKEWEESCLQSRR